MSEYTFSVIIPAHNEEKYIGKCLRSIKAASERVRSCKVQTIVVANRCTDRTAAIARKHGAEVLANDDKCIAAIRNTGVKAAKGKIIVTIDADSIMSKSSLREIKQMLESGRFIGGGTLSEFSRMSLGIMVSTMYVALQLAKETIKSRVIPVGGMFWFYKSDFEKIGGFDESLVSLEDMDFAKRLKKLGESKGKKYGVLKKSFIITSSRKFDEFGDWYLVKNRKLTKALFSGKDRKAADSFYYDVR